MASNGTERREQWLGLRRVSATPRLFFALVDEDRAVADRWDLRFGVVASTIVNMTPRKNGAQAYPYDFFPHLKPDETIEDALDAFFGLS